MTAHIYNIVATSTLYTVPSNLSGPLPLQSATGPVSGHVPLRGSATSNSSCAMSGDTVERDDSGYPVGEEVSKGSEKGGKKHVQTQSDSGPAQVGLSVGKPFHSFQCHKVHNLCMLLYP